MCYDAAEAEERLGKSVDRIHFDEAWYGYARFNPMYRDRYAMRGDPGTHPKDAPTVFATHSTHKLLPRCRRPPSFTSATAAAPSITGASTRRIARRRAPRRSTR